MKLQQRPHMVLGILGLCLLIVIVLVGFWTGVFYLVRQFHDPVIGSTVASQLLIIEQPLPKGWCYFGGENVFPMKSTSLINEKANTIVTICEMANPSHSTAEKLDASLNPIDMRGKFEVAESGQTIVAGQPMYYRCGRLTGTADGDVPTQRGVLVTPSGKAIIIEISEFSAKTFDAKIPQPLLDSIKGFPRK